MSQPKVFEFAKEIGIETIALMDKIRQWELPVKSHMAALNDETIEEIKKRLAVESQSKVTKKKKTAKKATAKAKKTGVVKKADASTTTEGAAKKKTVRKKTVIRRKAGESTSPEEKEAEGLFANTEESAFTETSAAPAEDGRFDSEVAASSAPEAAAGVVTQEQESSDERPSRSPVAPRIGGKIVGRMDLNRVTEVAKSKTAAPTGLRRATGPRNIRTGFVAPPVMEQVRPEPEAELRREKKKRAAATTTSGGPEVVEQKFTATEFRKREVIFQPKKKRVIGRGEVKKTQITTPKASKRVVRIHDTVTVQELANQLGVKAPQLIRKLIGEGVMANMNTELDFDTISLIVPEFGFEAENVAVTEDELLKQAAFGDVEAQPVSRPPVVTVMGHVDHGKTTLLDAIRKADVASSEAGGITQHIGAYRVELEGGKVATFIDTPGHEAFTAMRARGANVTDIAIIVVAADDGVMPQTVEAISHAKAAGVPIIVAVNKVDRPNANVERIKQQMTEYELIPEEWGGHTIFCEVSALQKKGITELLEQIHLVAEMAELKANPERSGTGTVIESKMAKGRGNVATLLVTDGTVRVGEFFAAGSVTGKIRSMANDRGEVVTEAGPGVPVEIMGLNETPEAGDRLDICKTEELAQALANLRRKAKDTGSTEETEAGGGISLDKLFSKVKAGAVQELSLVLKTDVAGSNEAIKGMFDKLKTDEVSAKIIHSGVGGISESDVLLASTAGGMVLGFNVRPDVAAQRLAKEKGVEIKTYTIIYELVDDIKKAMSGLLKPDIVEKQMGHAEVRETFSVPKIGTIAGCSVVDGKITRNDLLRLVRDGRVIYEGKISSLKRFKDDAKEVTSGYECGIGIENYNDIKVGDVIEAFVKEEIAREL